MKSGEFIPVEAIHQPPRVVIISGPSGVGKGTIVDALVTELADIEPDRRLSRSWTTRNIRDGENPDDYVFVTREEFELAVAKGQFLEWTEFKDNLYGTPHPDPSESIILEIEVDGALNVRRKAEQLGTLALHQFYYVLAEDPFDLALRLFGRGDGESKVSKIGRYSTFFERELLQARELGAHVVINRTVEDAVTNILDSMRGDFRCEPDLEGIVRFTEQYGPEILSLLRRMYLSEES